MRVFLVKGRGFGFVPGFRVFLLFGDGGVAFLRAGVDVRGSEGRAVQGFGI